MPEPGYLEGLRACLPREVPAPPFREPGYLQGLRRLCDEHGIALIFDEVITGFRLALGGAQAHFGVTPDLAIFGKALASGYPISVLAGREE